MLAAASLLLRELQLIPAPINWQEIKKEKEKERKAQNENQIHATTLNVKVSGMEKPFQLLDVQENTNTR